MKLSQLTTEQAADVLCSIAPYISNIIGDKALLDELAKKFNSKGKSVAEMYAFAAKKYAALVPLLLKEHRSDVFGVLSVLNESEPDKIAQQNILITMNQVKEALQDEELKAFFKLSLPGETA